MTLSSFWNALRRLKTPREEDDKPKLARVLTVFDLTALSVGSTLGLGVYVLAGSVAKSVAGPAVCLSFLVAAVASALAGLCYAEFASRVPKAGSAYIYSYVSVGEFIAFTIGWNLILEYVIGTAAVAVGMSNYIDALAGNPMSEFLTANVPINVNFLGKYPNIFAFFLVIAVSILLAVGVKESTRFNNVFTVLNLVTVAIVVVAGATKADIANWKIAKEDIPEEDREHAGAGGFLPFGIAGVMAGAAKCFFGFVGFDCVATTGEEAINPKKSIPLAIILSLVIIFVAYFSISSVLTLMLPYYLQDAAAPFPHVFEETELYTVKWIVTFGAIFALCTSLVGAMFPLPRILYAMGSDGVLFRQFSKINAKSLTPLLGTFISGILTGIMALFFDVEQLVDMMSIGTLMAYTIVAASVLVLRYEELIISTSRQYKHDYSPWKLMKHIFNLNGIKYPNDLSSSISKISIGIYFGVVLALCVCFSAITESNAWIITISVLGAMAIITLFILFRQPLQNVDLTFKVPLVPLLPCVSIIMNLYLMVQLDYQTWIRFIIWLLIGYLIYFSYGIRNSSERAQTSTDTPKNPVAATNGHTKKISDSQLTKL